MLSNIKVHFRWIKKHILVLCIRFWCANTNLCFVLEEVFPCCTKCTTRPLSAGVVPHQLCGLFYSCKMYLWLLWLHGLWKVKILQKSIILCYWSKNQTTQTNKQYPLAGLPAKKENFAIFDCHSQPEISRFVGTTSDSTEALSSPLSSDIYANLHKLIPSWCICTCTL